MTAAAAPAAPAVTRSTGAAPATHRSAAAPPPAPAPAAPTQEGRALRVDTTLGTDALLLHGFAGEEAVSRPFRFVLDLSAPGTLVPDADALLGTAASVTVTRPDRSERVVHGLVSRFRRNASGVSVDGYEMELVPWLWMLGLSADCRIYQKKSVPEIVTGLFDEFGFRDYRAALVKSYAPREYCVQYRETHLAFVSRLLEDEGIFYFFEHKADKHVLVLADGPAGVKPIPGGARLEPATGGAPAWASGRDAYTRLSVERAVHPAKVTLTDYDYAAPSTPLEVSLEAQRGGSGEVFDYPGGYTAPGEGNRYARLRVEEAESARETATGASVAAQLTPGATVELVGTGSGGSGDGEWFVLGVNHSAHQGGYRAGDSEQFSYENSFSAVRAEVPWRPPRHTARPRVRGTQSALVVGKAGEEIWTDPQGRVTLHFYWDRRSRRDEHSSCWVRVSTAWAGKGWGQFSVPRVGQEVLVDFLEGDPDRPVVVGRVYNAEQPPPCNPGGGGAVSGMRSKTHKGAGYNSMEMDDTAGKEKISIHAQYDMDTTVGHDMTTTVTNNDTQTVHVNRTITVDGTHTETVKGATSITVSEGNFSHTVSAGTATYDVKGLVTETFHAAQHTTVTQELAVTANNGVQVVGNAAGVYVEGNAKGVSIKGTPDFRAEGVSEAKIKSPKIALGDGEIAITGTKIVLSVGGNSITIDPSGVTIFGSLVKIN